MPPAGEETQGTTGTTAVTTTDDDDMDGMDHGTVAKEDVRTWTTIIYFLMMLPLGIVYFVTVVTWLAVGVSFLLVPVAGIAQRTTSAPHRK